VQHFKVSTENDTQRDLRQSLIAYCSNLINVNYQLSKVTGNS